MLFLHVMHDSGENFIFVKYGRDRGCVPFDRELNSESNDDI